MNTQRSQQTEWPRDLPPLVQPSPVPAQGINQQEIPELARLAGALAALAGRVDRLGESLVPRVSRDQRLKALAEARDWVTELGVPPGTERVHAELAVARYLTGE